MLDNGALRLVTNRDPEIDLRLIGGGHAPGPRLAPADVEAHVSLVRPVLLSAAGDGLTSQRTRASVASAAFVGLMEQAPIAMTWRDSIDIPPETLRSLVPLSIAQLRLEVLRALPNFVSPGTKGDLVNRPRGFSSRIVSFQVSLDERAVLTVASEPTTYPEIASRTGLAPDLVERICARLLSVGLLEHSGEKPAPMVVERVSVAEPDEPTRAALLSLLTSHLPDSEITLHDNLGALEESLKSAPANLILVNVSDTLAQAERFVSRVRTDLALSATIIAVLDGADPELDQKLPAYGYDAVLAKPILIDDIVAHIQRA